MDDLIIRSSCQEPSRQSPAFDCLWCVVVVGDKLWIPDLRNAPLPGVVLVLRVAWRGRSVAKSTLAGKGQWHSHNTRKTFPFATAPGAFSDEVNDDQNRRKSAYCHPLCTIGMWQCGKAASQSRFERALAQWCFKNALTKSADDERVTASLKKKS